MIEAFNRGDTDTVAAVLDEESQWDWSRSIGPSAAVYRGPGEIIGFWQEFTGSFEELKLEIEDVAEEGEVLVAGMLSVMKGRGGIEVSARNGWVMTFRGSKLARLEMFQSKAEAMAAAVDS
jgi:ketosteroid isomerase-like protein